MILLSNCAAAPTGTRHKTNALMMMAMLSMAEGWRLQAEDEDSGIGEALRPLMVDPPPQKLPTNQVDAKMVDPNFQERAGPFEEQWKPTEGGRPSLVQLSGLESAKATYPSRKALAAFLLTMNTSLAFKLPSVGPGVRPMATLKQWTPILGKPRHHGQMIRMTNGEPGVGFPKTPRTSVTDLLALSVPKLIRELASPEEDLILDSSDAAKILDKACEYAATKMDPETSTVSDDIELQKALTATYEALKKRGILRGFGSCANALSPLRKENFLPEDQERATGLETTAFAPPRGQGFNDIVFGSAAAWAVLYGQEALGLNPTALAGPIVAALAIDNLALRGSIGETIARSVRPAYREIVLKHEAGHLLVAYLLGNPIQACLLDSWSALKDGRFYGVQAGTVFYDPELGENMKSGRLSRTCLDRYSIVVMAGIAAEAMARGQAEGGRADEDALIQLLTSLDGGKSWDIPRIQNQARWGASQAFLLLRDHESAYNALCKALSGGESIGESIMAIEGALAQEAELPAEARKRLQPAKDPFSPIAAAAVFEKTNDNFSPTAKGKVADAKRREAEIKARLTEGKVPEAKALKPAQSDEESKASQAEIKARLTEIEARLTVIKATSAETDARSAEIDAGSAEIEATLSRNVNKLAEIRARWPETDARSAEFDAMSEIEESLARDAKSLRDVAKLAQMKAERLRMSFERLKMPAEIKARSAETDARSAEIDASSAKIEERLAEVDSDKEEPPFS